jgi:hypothetical protein
MSQISQIDYPLAFLRSDRFPAVGNTYNFQLDIRNITPLAEVRRIVLALGNNQWYWNVNITSPQSFKNSVRLPAEINDWYPLFRFLGYNNSGYLQHVDFYFPLPIVSTNVRPIYDARLGCSIWDVDQWKINHIRSFLNKWGFDYSTLGLGIQPKGPTGRQLVESENDWAKGGDCFVAVLTRRDRSMNSGQGIPPVWPHTESGFSYDGNKPQLAFVEKGVAIDALFVT